MNKEVIKEIIQGNNLNDLRIITNISKIMDTNEVVYSNYSRKEKVFDDEYFHTDNVEVKEGVLKLTVKRIKESIRFNSTRTAIESRIYTLVGTIGHGTTAQWNVSTSIPASTAMLGDLAFLATPGTRKVNHIGIVVGRNGDGQILVAHCSSGANNVSVATAESVGFLYYRRPAVLIN